MPSGKPPIKSKSQGVTYTTEDGEEFTVSPKGNLRGTQEVQRVNYISPGNAEIIIKGAKADPPRMVSRTQAFGLRPYEEFGGFILYEELGVTKLYHEKVVDRNPPFSRNGEGPTVEKKVE